MKHLAAWKLYCCELAMMHALYPRSSRAFHCLLPTPLLSRRGWVSSLLSPAVLHTSSISSNTEEDSNKEAPPIIRIGIVGGGIAGVSVAHALATTYSNDNKCPAFHVTVLEGDPPCPSNNSRRRRCRRQDQESKPWIAATARNANSLVPGAAMHVFSRPSVLWQVLQDTAVEWFERQLRSINPTNQSTTKTEDHNHYLFVHDDANIKPPPYFALHLSRCIGPSASAPERWSFVNFISQFLYYAIIKGGGADERGRVLHQLASANRVVYLKAAKAHYSSSSSSSDDDDKDDNETDINNSAGATITTPRFGHSAGFLALYRSKQAAVNSVEEAHGHGESAKLITDWKEIVELEPRLRRLPNIADMYAVRRPNDYTASCESFICNWIEESCATGIVDYQHKSGKVKRVVELNMILSQEHPQDNNSNNNNNIITTAKQLFQVEMEDGSSQTFDMLVLAAGTETPLFADQLGVAKYCPTYPLRGFSLTVFIVDDDEKPGGKGEQAIDDDGGDDDDGIAAETIGSSSSNITNLLRQPFSVDNMYCSSVSGSMARWAGFGEFVGYREKAENNVSSQGPEVMSRYARKIFPDAVGHEEDNVLPCFRPLSPDDIALAGEIATHPGLFLHTGHGTLGWTMGLATGDCLAQCICDRMKGHQQHSSTQEGHFTLQDGTKIDRKLLSPNRFVG